MAHVLELKIKSVRSGKALKNSSPDPAPNWIKRCIVRFKAKRRVNKIMHSLHEAKEIHAGRKPAQTFDEFLREL